MNKKLSPLRKKNDVTHAFILVKLRERISKKQIVTVTSYGRNKNLDYEKKNQEKANKSLSYCFAAINALLSKKKQKTRPRMYNKWIEITL